MSHKIVLCGICFDKQGTDTDDASKPTQRICKELLRFEKWCDIINLTNLNL